MLLSSLITIPGLGTIIVASIDSYKKTSEIYAKTIALGTSVINLIISLVIFILFDFSSNQFQFVGGVPAFPYGIYLGVDAISIYFVLLTTLIFPIVIISN